MANFKVAMLCGLAAMTQASPLPNQQTGSLGTLDAWTTNGEFSCPDGTILDEGDVENAVKTVETTGNNTLGGYPLYLGTTIGVPNTNFTDTITLKEFPIQVGGVYSGGVPGDYRVVVDTDNDLLGVIQRTVTEAGEFYAICTGASNSKRGNKDKDKQKSGILGDIILGGLAARGNKDKNKDKEKSGILGDIILGSLVGRGDKDKDKNKSGILGDIILGSLKERSDEDIVARGDKDKDKNKSGILGDIILGGLKERSDSTN